MSRIAPSDTLAQPDSAQARAVSGGTRSSETPSRVRRPRYSSSSLTASGSSRSASATGLRPAAIARS
ncbi:MAG TPA: hypothetical protein VG500_11260 [Gemmatimonadales bacterium]|nr:hypothetical protein [Gemmatimonadales bacterium]